MKSRPHLSEWVKKFSKDNDRIPPTIVSKFLKASDSVIPITACSIVKAHLQGMPLKDTHIDYLITIITRIASFKEDPSEEEQSSGTALERAKPTIQDRLNEIAKEHIFHFVDLEDEVIDGKSVDPKSFDYLTSQNVPQAMLGKISAYFEGHRNELVEARAGTCDQLKEGYKHYKAADYKRFETFYSKLFEGIEQYSTVKKATKKAKVRKPPAKEKVVAKLNYLKTDSALKLVSINPVDIIGASQLWVYNIKTRKLGRYIADESEGGVLSVKGTAIVGYSELKSVSKTLRKPEQQLKEFMSSGKIQLRKYLDNIKATEVKLNGRINADTILLKVG